MFLIFLKFSLSVHLKYQLFQIFYWLSIHHYYLFNFYQISEVLKANFILFFFDLFKSFAISSIAFPSLSYCILFLLRLIHDNLYKSEIKNRYLQLSYYIYLQYDGTTIEFHNIITPHTAMLLKIFSNKNLLKYLAYKYIMKILIILIWSKSVSL